MTEQKLKKAMDKYGDMLFRICLLTLKNQADAEDALQETFIVYFRKNERFSGSEHEKAWLITVAQNKCRDILRSNRRIISDSDELLQNYAASEKDCRVLEALSELPEKFRLILSLHYIEGFKVREIARMLDIKQSTVKMRLSKGRKLLEEIYRKEFM